MEVVELFPRNYGWAAVEVNDPGFEPQNFYPPIARTYPSRYDLTLEFRHFSGKPFRATFASREGEANGVYTTPDPDVACVVAGGAAYFVHIDEPTQWEQDPGKPIEQVRLIPEHGLFLFASEEELWARTIDVVLWNTGCITDYKIELKEVTEEEVKGVTYLYDKEYDFTVNFKTGVLTGGQPPPVPPGRYDKYVEMLMAVTSIIFLFCCCSGIVAFLIDRFL